MTDDAMLGAFRRQVILRAGELGNISQACREAGISRTTYYKWLERWLQYGPGGLEPHAKRRPQMPNQVSPVVEQAILDYISVWPTHGARRISQELAQPQWGGHLISHWGVSRPCAGWDSTSGQLACAASRCFRHAPPASSPSTPEA